MFLVLTAIDENNQLREFTCHLQKLEVGFDLLNDIVAKGQTLVKARLIDNEISTLLPLDAFDGTSFLTAIQELEKEWQSLLADPISSTHDELIQWMQRRVWQYEKRIVSLDTTLSRLKKIRLRALEYTLTKPTQSEVINHYTTLINNVDVRLIKAHLIHNELLKRLTTLGDC